MIDSRPGAVLLAEIPSIPVAGAADRSRPLRWAAARQRSPASSRGGRSGTCWPTDRNPAGPVEAAVDPAFRQLMRELHTGLHIVNALVFQSFDGALVTGVQMNEDGTARIDFDLPEADNDRLKALDPAINDLDSPGSRRQRPLCDAGRARDGAGPDPLALGRAAAHPDGQVRIVEIVGLDRQACGGTHLASTGPRARCDSQDRQQGPAQPSPAPRPGGARAADAAPARAFGSARRCCCGCRRCSGPATSCSAARSARPFRRSRSRSGAGWWRCPCSRPSWRGALASSGPARRHALLILGCGAFGIAGYNALGYLALQTMPAASVAFLNSTLPLMVPMAAFALASSGSRPRTLAASRSPSSASPGSSRAAISAACGALARRRRASRPRRRRQLRALFGAAPAQAR